MLATCGTAPVLVAGFAQPSLQNLQALYELRLLASLELDAHGPDVGVETLAGHGRVAPVLVPLEHGVRKVGQPGIYASEFPVGLGHAGPGGLPGMEAPGGATEGFRITRDIGKPEPGGCHRA